MFGDARPDIIDNRTSQQGSWVIRMCASQSWLAPVRARSKNLCPRLRTHASQSASLNHSVPWNGGVLDRSDSTLTV